MSTKISTDIALLSFLALIVAVIIFPILDNRPLSQHELLLLQQINASETAGNLGEIFQSGNNLFMQAYAHIVMLIEGLIPGIKGAFLLRLPGALAVMALTLSLFRFDGNIDRLNASFLASLLFLSSTLIMNLTFQASEITIPASLFILALMSLYHWLNHPSKRYFWLVVATAAISTVLIGATSPLALALMAYVFIIASKRYSAKSYLTITLALLLSCVMAFLAIYVLVGDTMIAMDIFDIRQQLAMSPESSMANVFFEYIVLALFPWSIPLIISIPWLARNPRWIYDKFLNLGLLQRYSIIIFLFSLPFLFFATDLTFILFIASMFFNMPLIGKYVLLQFHHHPTVWKTTGTIFAVIVALLTIIFIILKSGYTITIGTCSMSISDGWSGWSIFLTIAALSSIYTLWRNTREIKNNNRFMYNIIFMYLVAAILANGYIIGDITITTAA